MRKFVLLFISALALSACTKTSNLPVQAPAPAKVSVAKVVQQNIQDWDIFTGTLEAPEQVQLRPRVAGYIQKVSFVEGDLVNQGDVLFEIDPAPFAAEVARLEAELVSGQSAAKLAQTELRRARKLSKQKAIASEVLDTRHAQYQQATANVKATRAALQLARLNLTYTKVTSPIAGRVSRANITAGNYVSTGSTVLTRIVSSDTIYAYFNADEHSYIDYLSSASNGAHGLHKGAPVWLTLASNKSLKFEGQIDFIDNQVDASTGTIRARAVFNNANGLLKSGMFARVRLMASAPYTGVLVADKAIATDLNNQYVLVLNAENKTEYRPVVLGALQAGLRVIKSGLQGNEAVVVNGLQRVRPGAEVSPTIVPMATDAQLEQLAKRNKLSLPHHAKQPSKHASNSAESNVTLL